MSNEIIGGYLNRVIKDFEQQLVYRIGLSKIVKEELEEKRAKILVFKAFFKDENYLPKYFLDDCYAFNKAFDLDKDFFQKNIDDIRTISNLKSNLSWFEGDQDE